MLATPNSSMIYDPRPPPGVSRHHQLHELQLLGKMLGQGEVRALHSLVMQQLTGLGKIEVTGHLELQLHFIRSTLN